MMQYPIPVRCSSKPIINGPNGNAKVVLPKNLVGIAPARLSVPPALSVPTTFPSLPHKASMPNLRAFASDKSPPTPSPSGTGQRLSDCFMSAGASGGPGALQLPMPVNPFYASYIGSWLNSANKHAKTMANIDIGAGAPGSSHFLARRNLSDFNLLLCDSDLENKNLLSLPQRTARGSMSCFSMRSLSNSRSPSRSPTPPSIIDNNNKIVVDLLSCSNGIDHEIDVQVGAHMYRERLSVLLSQTHSLLAENVRAHCNQPNCQDAVLVLMAKNDDAADLSVIFQHVLSFLRRGARAVMPSDERDLRALLRAAQHWRIIGLAALVWCLIERISLQAIHSISIDSAVVWNPGCVPLLWRSMAAAVTAAAVRGSHNNMHRIHQGYFTVGYIQKCYKPYGKGSSWCSYDISCPNCDRYDFIPMPYGEMTFNPPLTTQHYTHMMLNAKGRVLQLFSDSCALIEIGTSSGALRFHVPKSALLPAAYVQHRDPTLH